jgi:hypothetical protein
MELKMISKSPAEKSEAYYVALGGIKWASDSRDIYRMKRTTKYLVSKSVFDVGYGKTDSLNLIKNSY